MDGNGDLNVKDTPLPGDKLSILGHLKERKEEIKEGEILALPVPRWSEPEIWVRYHPVDHDKIRAAQRGIKRAPKHEQFRAEVSANIDILIHGCEEVYAVLDGQEYSLRPDEPKGAHVKFDPALAANLGLSENSSARAVVRELFITDGDIISQANELVRWSGYRDQEAEDRLESE